MRKKFLFFIVLPMLILLSCEAGSVRAWGPADRSDMQLYMGRVGVMRSNYCSIAVENVDESTWNYLHGFKMFRGKGSGYPSNTCFSIMIANNWNKPFQVNKVEIVTAAGSVQPEFFDYVNDKNYPEERFSISLNELWKTRRLIVEKLLVGEIDFGSDTIEYSMDFIVPGDTVIFFRTFRWIPLASEKLKLRIGIKYNQMEKVIDFDMTDFEYYETGEGETRILPEVKLKDENR